MTNSSQLCLQPSLARQAPVRSALIMRLSAMGDIIHAMAAVTALRAALPECRIGWAVEGRWSPLLCAPGSAIEGPRGHERPLADEVFPVDIRGWRRHPASRATWRDMHACFTKLRSARYDMAIDLQGAIRSAVLSRIAATGAVWGEAAPREAPASLLYRHRAPVNGAHVVEQNLSLVSAAAGVVLRYHPPALPSDAASRSWCEQLLDRLKSRICLLSPGAGWGAKCWPAASFAQVARALAEDGIHCLVNVGPGEELLARELIEASGGTAETVSCSISQLIELTRHAAIFIGGDSGPMHLAAALAVPVVALFGPTNPARNGPFATRSTVLRSRESVTSYKHTPRPDESLHAIPAVDVILAARKLLQEEA